MRLALTLSFIALWFAGTASAALSPEQAKLLPLPSKAKINFTKDIRPIIENGCVKCHGNAKRKGGFNLDTREALLKGGETGPAVVPGKSAESYFIELVSGLNKELVMPEKGSKLKPAQIALLRAWIDQGLPWDAGFTFKKPVTVPMEPRVVALPQAKKGSGLTNPVDLLLQSYLEKNKISPAKLVEDRVFARRVWLDVIGLLPSPEELDAFLADKRADKREQLVRQLLADNPRYAEHWLTFWNDILRNDYKGTGFIDNGRKQITGWLYSALATNMPYDRFVSQLISPVPESEGFVKGIVWRGAVNASQTPPVQFAQNVSQIFMGVNLKCASCHDSFINDWELADAYALANINADAPLEIFRCDTPTGKKAGTKFIYPDLGSIDAAAPRVERLKQLAGIMTSPKDGRLTRTIVNRIWARFLGRGLVEPVDEMDNPPWSADVLDWLAADLAASGHDLKHTMELILTSRAYQLPAVNVGELKEKSFVFRGPTVRRLTAEQFRDALTSITGAGYAKPDADADFTLGRPDADGYHTDAKWIWKNADAAKQARVETIFLRRVVTLASAPTEALAVAACDNSYTLFVNGQKAGTGKDYTKPDLIDIRAMLRAGENIIAVEAVNGTASGKAPKDAKEREGAGNPAGFLLHVRARGSGGAKLDFGTEGAWVWSDKKQDGWEKAEFKADDWERAFELGPAGMAPWSLENKVSRLLAGASLRGRTRASLVASDPLLIALGRPNREQVLTTRATAATTLQALELTNGGTLAALLKRGADGVLASKPATSRELVTRLYTHALGRKPTAKEQPLAEELVGATAKKEGVEDLLWALLALPEFQLIY